MEEKKRIKAIREKIREFKNSKKEKVNLKRDVVNKLYSQGKKCLIEERKRKERRLMR